MESKTQSMVLLWQWLTVWVQQLAGVVVGWPAILMLLGTGLYLTFRLRFVQCRAYWHAVRITCGHSQNRGAGQVSNFEALSTVLSGTIGTGNIAGVATAITLGGPGAIFWMWLTALFGMATKFASCTLAHHFREVDEAEDYCGGPMYTLKNGLGKSKLGGAFALFMILASVTTGGMVQSNSVVDGIGYLLPSAEAHHLLVGCVLAALVGLVIIGGVTRIARVASVVVPFMALMYCLSALLILVLNVDRIGEAFHTIFVGAFHPSAIGGGALGTVIQYGVARALFASEAGLGTAAVGLAPVRAEHPVRAGLVGMLGPSIDTLLICTMTALVLIITGSWGAGHPSGLDGASLSAYAFGHGLFAIGKWAAQVGAMVVGLGLIFFAYTTAIAWSYYGERSVEYLFSRRGILPYRLSFIVILVIGAVAPLSLVWNLADIANVLIAVPNLISLILLTPLLKRLKSDYFAMAKTKTG